MKKGKFTEIMEEMDSLEKVKISDDLIDTLRDYFKDEVEKEVLEDEKVAKGSFDNLNDSKPGSDEDGQSDRV